MSAFVRTIIPILHNYNSVQDYISRDVKSDFLVIMNFLANVYKFMKTTLH